MTGSNIKVSILVPSFNQGPYISNLIRSLLGQSYSNWEMIIQDGGSKDKTAEICREFAAADSRISFRSEKDSGFADAVNRAMDRATGTIGTIQSTDDFLVTPYVLESAVALFAANPRIELLGGASVVVDDKLRQLSMSEKIAGYVRPDSVYQLNKDFSQSGTFFTLERGRAVGKLNPNVDMVADTDFWIRLSCYDRMSLNTIYHTTEIWGAAMIQPDQRSADFSKFHLGRAKMFSGFIDDSRIPFAKDFKKNVADGIITRAIAHFEANNLDATQLLELYKKLHDRSYAAPEVSFRSKVVRLIRGSKKVHVPNSIHEVYLGDLSKCTLYDHGWFNQKK